MSFISVLYNYCRPEREKGDILTMEKMRLFLYRAVSNPAYICQTEEDPILRAFELSAELSKEASFDREFYPDYKGLSSVGEILFFYNFLFCELNKY